MSNEPATPAAYMTVREAAAFVRVHPEHLKRLCRQGRGPRVIRLGRALRYARADLDAWMAQHAQGAAA